MVQQAIRANPVTNGSAPIWGYLNVTRGNVLSTPAVLATGTEGISGRPGTQATLPGYVTETDYIPGSLGYGPKLKINNLRRIPNSAALPREGNGRVLVGTYEPHEYAVATYQSNQNRIPYMWEELRFPPGFRTLLSRQQVQKYNVSPVVQSSPVLPSSLYSLGYVTSAQTAAQIGGRNSLGYM